VGERPHEASETGCANPTHSTHFLVSNWHHSVRMEPRNNIKTLWTQNSRFLAVLSRAGRFGVVEGAIENLAATRFAEAT